MKTFTPRSLAEWRKWLEKHHARRDEVWLVYFKKHTGRPTVDYGESVEEALCFGWIDGKLRSIDKERYARRFTPRRTGSNWSPSNRKRVERLVAAGRMQKPGLELVEAAKRDGTWDAPDRPEAADTVPPELRRALSRNPEARAFFDSLTAAQRRRFITWIAVAKRPETKKKRVEKSIAFLERGEKLGMV